ncbi:hypothetical protein D3C87_615400 [compost metagenome]
MSHHRSFRSLLAVAVLTTGLAGCTDLNGLFKLPGDNTVTDGNLKPGEDLKNPGDQLLSNSAATAISGIESTLRDVGALKNMASQQPLLSNSSGNLLSNAAGSLLSNGMSGYRVAGMSHEEYNRLTWNDTGNWPDPSTLTEPVTFSGVIKGSVDNVEVEHYTYTVTMGPDTYSRQETVVKSAFRKTGLYHVTGQATFGHYNNDPNSAFFVYVVSGSSTFDPQGVKRKVDYVLDMVIDGSSNPWDVRTTVKGLLPTGTDVDLTMDYLKDFVNDTDPDLKHTLVANGKMTLDGKPVKFKSSADVVENGGITGNMQLGLAADFWLRFDFASGQAMQATRRNDAGDNLGALEVTSDKSKAIVKLPGEDKPEHLDLSLLPRLYLMGLESALPPL